MLKGNTGGLGIFLMRRIMDEIHYSYKQGVHNELRMVKFVKLDKNAPPSSGAGSGAATPGSKAGAVASGGAAGNDGAGRK